MTFLTSRRIAGFLAVVIGLALVSTPANWFSRIAGGFLVGYFFKDMVEG